MRATVRLKLNCVNFSPQMCSHDFTAFLHHVNRPLLQWALLKRKNICYQIMFVQYIGWRFQGRGPKLCAALGVLMFYVSSHGAFHPLSTCINFPRYSLPTTQTFIRQTFTHIIKFRDKSIVLVNKPEIHNLLLESETFILS